MYRRDRDAVRRFNFLQMFIGDLRLLTLLHFDLSTLLHSYTEIAQCNPL